MAFIFEKLLVYQRALDFADRVMTKTRDFPKGTGFIRDQLNRAALSISLNIAEGNGRIHKKHRLHLFAIARGSLQECVPLLELASRQSLIESNWAKREREEMEEISRMLSGLMRGVVNRQR